MRSVSERRAQLMNRTDQMISFASVAHMLALCGAVRRVRGYGRFSLFFCLSESHFAH